MRDSHSPREFQNMTVLFETDWLASNPVFFNRKTGLASKNPQEVTVYSGDIKFHPEGLYNYLEYGYSVFEQTPIEDVQFLPPAARLLKDHHGKLSVEKLPDPIEKWWDYRLNEEDVIELIRTRVQEWEASLPLDQEIVLPLSGGYDSRLLLWCLNNKDRVRAYTYGISEDQGRSTEIVHARALADFFRLRWAQIPLGGFHQYFDDWDAEFGVSTHSHGMYHFEFYSSIRESLKGNQAFLSGIIGDSWAGSILKKKLRTANYLLQLSYSHGLCAEPNQIELQISHDLRDQFWAENSERLEDHRFQVVTSMRFKLILLSYLIRIPQLFDFQPWSPFLDIDVAMAMLNLPHERRANRQWQFDFFSKVGLDLENQGLKSNRTNTLDYQAMKRQPLNPLDLRLLSKLFDENYINWINSNINISTLSEARSNIFAIPKFGGLLRRFGIKDPTLEAYSAYLSLKPLENFLYRASS